MKRQSLFFTAPFEIEIRETTIQPPGPGELLVETLISAISAGTELLIYRGLAPNGMSTDENISALTGSLAYPLQYGYAAVGTVVKVGENLGQDWVGKPVFSFQPRHADESIQVIAQGESFFEISSRVVFLTEPHTSLARTGEDHAVLRFDFEEQLPITKRVVKIPQAAGAIRYSE